MAVDGRWKSCQYKHELECGTELSVVCKLGQSIAAMNASDARQGDALELTVSCQ